ncbi:sensor histidine kinase [Vallitalea sp.]|jgi:two-component system sensor histidine kinase YesM|uniref:sensor histidine kinase n=1 Tax=Vallitalea sp. TaxID=1882829 RepID=UPI0025DA5A49|nr:histidine kinase [Vallitalea sp.]MCT4685958.1 histidine kinase [Vallitalea sp.]
MLCITTNNIKSKIVLYSTVSLLIIGTLSNIFIYQHFNKILSHKVDAINNINISNISSQIDIRLSNLNDLTLLITNNMYVQKIIDYKSLDNSFIKSKSIEVQNILTNYIDSSIVNKYIKKAIIFNEYGMIIESVGKEHGLLNDYNNIITSKSFNLLRDNPQHLYQIISKPVVTIGNLCIPVLKPIYRLRNKPTHGWLYMEIDLGIIIDILDTYKSYTSLFIVTKNNNIIHPDNPLNIDFNEILHSESGNFNELSVKKYNINTYNWEMYTVEQLTNINMETKNMLSVFYLTVVVSLVAGLLIFIGASNVITRPIIMLKKRIKKISSKDFSYDNETENLPGEIGEIGHVINEMARDIEELLENSIKITNEKKNFEIAMLQSQVNPHFLYNTLNSIHWMATLQKNTGICKLVDALTNLLKNMAKSFSDKVILEEELRLLDDYLTIQSIRYMESFEFVNNIDPSLYNKKIVKMTLQPLVENAIFHGIEPKGKFGTITLGSEIRANSMFITVTDDGIGMTDEEILRLSSGINENNKGSINGIGYYNVNLRLKLIYGDNYGLSIQSELSKYTTITIKIPIEE